MKFKERKVDLTVICNNEEFILPKTKETVLIISDIEKKNLEIEFFYIYKMLVFLTFIFLMVVLFLFLFLFFL